MLKDNFTERLKQTPRSPGVYRMYNGSGKIVYIGKASNLQNRLRSYFNSSKNQTPKIKTLLKVLENFDFTVTESEQEALILECNLIKEYQPRFNSRLKDDKSYPFIKIDTSEEFPQVYITRNISLTNPNDKYFGPYASAGSVRKTLALLKKLFPYRSCTKAITGTDERACLDYHIGRCVGPCIGATSKVQYNEIINQVIMFLEGDTSKIVKSLKTKMLSSAENLEFEKASHLRDQIKAIEKVHEGQKVLKINSSNFDTIAFSQSQGEAWVEVFFIRQGKLIGRDNYLMSVGEEDDESSIQTAFIKQFYKVTPYVPPLILTQYDVTEEDKDILLRFLSDKRHSKVSIHTPKRGERKNLIKMVEENASKGMDQLKISRFVESDNNESALIQIQEALNLPEKPTRIECYDISNIQGTNAVGSMIVFENASPKTSDYRRFKIKSVKGIDDYSMMQEMLLRRFKKISELGNESIKGDSWVQKPDLVLIDGGKGHLSAALQIFLNLGITNISIASIAKSKEEIFVPQTPEPILLPRNSQGLFLLQRARDEAHRFAITYHKARRSKSATYSSLDIIPGIGPKKKRQLIHKFGSVKIIKEASISDIASTPGMTLKLAHIIKEYL
ncbi:MAG: excinuclease ABC subunit UvrC [Dehalococcoidia bacterium]